MTSARQQNIQDLALRAATYRRSGSESAAARAEAKADQYRAMTDEQYDAQRAALTTPAIESAARMMAASVLGL